MKAQDVKKGAKYYVRDQSGRVLAGWIATDDAVVSDGKVYLAVKSYGGNETALTWNYDHEVTVE